MVVRQYIACRVGGTLCDFGGIVSQRWRSIGNFYIDNKLAVHGDADLLFQLFANLLDNAIKFSPDASEVRIAASVEHGEVKVTIKDAGPGIPDEEKAHVFRHFYRGDESRGSEGCGLGLSLVKAVVDKHRAEIELKDGYPGLEVRITLQPYQ